jgi:hypothetical protein
MANQTVSIDQLGTALSAMLDGYSEEVKAKADEAGEKAIKKLVKLTKASAPIKTGSFYRNIAWTVKPNVYGGKDFHWYVKAPDYRLTHLLVHGHATVNGGRVPGDPFLHKALDEVLPEYLENLEGALSND